jgi:hypothetical protein
MLKVNVGLSRKLSRDYNSTGFSLNLEGELGVGPDDPEALVEKIKEFYDLAEEALNQQIERHQGESAIASRDETPAPQTSPPRNPITITTIRQPATLPQPTGNGHGPSHGHGLTHGPGHAGNGEGATNKQLQYLLNLGTRHGLTPPQLETRIETILGRRVGVYDLSKKEAGEVIDALSQNGTPATSGRGRSGR